MGAGHDHSHGPNARASRMIIAAAVLSVFFVIELTTALLMTRTRFITSGESEVFDRRNYSANLSPAVACACAATPACS